MTERRQDRHRAGTHPLLRVHLLGPLDREDPGDGYAVARHHPLAQVAVTEELQMPGHLSLRHRLRGFLQLQQLVVHALALVGHDKEGVDGALGAAGSGCGCRTTGSGGGSGTRAPPGQHVALKARTYGQA